MDETDDDGHSRGTLRLRILYAGGSIGPGKVRLLEGVRRTGSISAAARAVDMPFRRAWQLIDTMHRVFRDPVVKASAGGRAGGGAELTPLGEELVERYRAMERAALEAAGPHMARLDSLTRPPPEPEQDT
ncbi:winged helix-turn-helix domain-containing protein [Azospirillum sp. ST 5-10]|uniref:winged helix-turn-helix domain-containing protein n=1 Tax=unclassified Azospirillum TaxID=2630922 RepID=UPI003F4A14A8